MGFFENLANDLKMGFGGKERTKDFEARTARTIARQDGFSDVGQSKRAVDYMTQKGVTQADIGNPATSTAPGYTSFRDRFDGGGMGMSGARFSRGDVSSFDKDGDNYISEQEYIAQENNPLYRTSTERGIPSLSNRFLGARPLGSYAQERNLLQNTGVPGTNIGTSGPADYLMGGGFLGNMLRGGRPSTKQLANPTLPRDARFPNNVVESLRPKIRPVDDTMEPETGLTYSAEAEKAKAETIENLPFYSQDQFGNVVLMDKTVPAFPKDTYGDVVLNPADREFLNFARGGIVSLVRK